MLHLKPNTALTPQSLMRQPFESIQSAEVGPYRVQIYDQDAFEALDWPLANDDATLGCYIYQSREFLSVWLATMGPARKARAYFVVVERAQDGAVMWLPLVVEPQFGCAFLRFPDGGMADYNGPIIRRDLDFGGHLPGVWAAILESLPPVDVIDFVKMPATLWDDPNPLLRIGPTTQNDEGYFLPIAGTFEQYLADPGRKPRAKKLRQLFRKLERMGPVELGAVRDPERAASVRAFIEKHKTLQYQRTLGFTQFDKPGVTAFVDRLCEPASLASFTRLTALMHGDSIVGAQLNFVTPRREQGFMTTFDAERFAFFSPGRQVQLHLIERAFADGLRVFDLGHGDNPYKHPWMTEVLRLYSLEQAQSWRGRLFLAARTLRRKVPLGLGQRLKTVLRPRRPGPGNAVETES